MKTIPIFRPVLALLIACLPLRAEDEIEKAFRDALYAEEVKGDTEAALKAYQDVSVKLEQQRDMAATAMFRQAECLRKLGRKDEAATLYNKVLAQYGDKERVAKQSRENLVALGQSPVAPAAAPSAPDRPVGLTDEEAKELTRLKALANNSPDLLMVPGEQNSAPLTMAAAKGQTEVVRWLLEKIPARTPAVLADPLSNAAQAGHLKICELLLKAGVAEKGGAALSAALNLAARNGHIRVCELLINSGADVSAGAPLTDALEGKHVELARLLLSKKTDPNLTGAGKLPPVPAWGGGVRSTKRTVRAVPNTQPPPSQGMVSPLQMAAADDQLPAELLTDIIKAGANLNQVAEISLGGEDTYPMTALGTAVIVLHAEKVRLLLAAKADVNQMTGDLDGTALLLALMNTNADSASAEAANHGIIAQLTAAGADWKAKLSNGDTTLHVAARRGLVQWVDAAIKAGVDVNAADSQGFTALHFAAQTGNPESVRKLIAAGAKAEVIASDEALSTPLTMACFHAPRSDASLDVLKALLDAGANPNPDKRGDYLLPLSAVMNPNTPGVWPEAAILLTRRGARPGYFFTPNNSSTWRTNVNPPAPGAPGQKPKVSEDRLGAVFRELWKAVHWRDNPRLPHALWLDEGEPMRLTGGALTFEAKFCDEGALPSPPSLRTFLRQCPELFSEDLQTGPAANSPVARPVAQPPKRIARDWRRATVTRVKGGKEEIIPVDLAALAAPEVKAPNGENKIPAGGTDVALQWGDVVNIPWRETEQDEVMRSVREWCRQDKMIKARIELAGGGVVSNAPAGEALLWSTEGKFDDMGNLVSENVWREAGIPFIPLHLDLKHLRPKSDGTMETTETWDFRHGDIFSVQAPEPQPKISDEAMRSGVWLCHSMEGPFWQVSAPYYECDFQNYVPPLAGLLVALMAPNPLPFASVDWEKARVRSLAAKDKVAKPEWEEKKLLEAWPMAQWKTGTVLILPQGKEKTGEPPAPLREALTKDFSFEWSLAIGQQPDIVSRYTPRFFRRTERDGKTVWQDLDPNGHEGALLPEVSQLLKAHPRAEFLSQFKKFRIRNGDGRMEKETSGGSGWISPDGKILTAPQADVPPPSPPSPPAPRPPRRTVLPTQNQ